VRAARRPGRQGGPALAIVAYLSSALAQRAIPAAHVGTNPRSTDAHAATHVAPVAAGANPPATGTPGATLWRAARTDLLGQPVLRTVTLANAFANSAAMAANTLLPVVTLTTLGLPPASYALLGTVGAIAGVAGAATASRMTARLGLRAARSLGAVCLVASAATVAALTTGTLPGSALLWLSAQSALAAIGISLMMISGSDLPARLVPPERLGAATGGQQAVVGVMPLAALGFGTLGSASLAGATVAWALCAAAALTLSLALPRAGQASRG
jgi:MFS family permease